MVFRSRTGAVVSNPQVFGAVKVSNEAFEVGIMEFRWACGELRKCGDSICNIGAITSICEHKFSKHSAIGESHGIFEVLM